MIERSLWSGIPVSVEFRKILAMLVLAALCFIAGIIVRTGPGLRAKNAVEETLLEKLPGYTLLRGRAGRVAGQAGERGFAPALSEIEEALVPALIVEKLRTVPILSLASIYFLQMPVMLARRTDDIGL